MMCLRDDESGLAQVVEYAASLTLLLLIFTAFYTALGYQETYYADPLTEPLDKAVVVTDFLIGDTGYLAGANTSHWELYSPDDLREIQRVGLSTGEYGVLSYEKLQGLEKVPYDRALLSLGLAKYSTDAGMIIPDYNINITITDLDGNVLVSWGYNITYSKTHTVVTRAVLILHGDQHFFARLRLDLM